MSDPAASAAALVLFTEDPALRIFHHLASLSVAQLLRCCEVCLDWSVRAKQGELWAALLQREYLQHSAHQEAFVRFRSEFQLETVWFQDPNKLHVGRPGDGIAQREATREASQAVIQAYDNWVPACFEWPEANSRVSCSYNGGLLLIPLEDTRFIEEHCTVLAQTTLVAPTGRESFIAMDLDRPRQLLVAGSDLGTVYLFECDVANGQLQAARRVPVPTYLSAELQRPEMIQSILIESGGVCCAQLAGLIGSGVSDECMSQGCESGTIQWRSLQASQSDTELRMQCGGVQELRGHSAAVMSMRQMLSGQLVSCAMDQRVIIWDMETRQAVQTINQAHARSVHCLDIAQHDGGSTFFTGSRDHTIKLWDSRTCEAVAELKGHLGSVTSLSVEGFRLVSGGGFNRGAGDVEVLNVDSTVRLWDLRMNKQLWSIPISPTPTGQHPAWTFERDPVLCVKLMKTRVMSGHGDGSIRVFDFSPY